MFYERVNELLAEAGFDVWLEALCRPHYSQQGRGSIAPGRYFRMLMVGDFEEIDSQRGIAWRCADSLSLKSFLGCQLHAATPEHSSLARITSRLPLEIYHEVFAFVLRLVHEHGLLKGKTLGVDSTTLEANAAMKSIVRKDSGDDWEAHLKKLAAAEGIEISSRADAARFDKQRAKKGKKKCSNEDWQSPSDPDARITKRKAGSMHLAYKAENAVDLDTGAITAAEIDHADQADSATLEDTLTFAVGRIAEIAGEPLCQEVVADKGDLKNETLPVISNIGTGLRTYIPEPLAVNIYYSTDGGQTVKIAYSFGRNPHFQEKGTEPAAFLGDRGNPVLCRHIHAVVFNPAERAFYACTGDINRGHGNECHWLRGEYDARADKWDWQVLVSVNSNSRYKSGGICFVDGQLYWAADANGPKLPNEKYDRGIFRCAPAELADPKKHTLLFNAEFEMANMIIEDGVILAGHCAPASTYKTGIAISPDLGKTWAQYDLAELGPRSPVRFHPKNSDGWFRVDLRKGWIERAEVLFIKPKP